MKRGPGRPREAAARSCQKLARALRQEIMVCGDDHDVIGTLSRLTHLELDLLGMTYGASAHDCGGLGRSSGLVWDTTSGLTQLRHLRLYCRSASINPDRLRLLAHHCPLLHHLELRVPLRRADAAVRAAPARGASWSLPAQLQTLLVDNTDLTGPLPAVQLQAFPPGLRRLSLRRVALHVEQEGPSPCTVELVAAHPRLRTLALNATAATPAGLAVLAGLHELRDLEIAVADQESAGALSGCSGLQELERVDVVVPSGPMGFVSDCVRDHLIRLKGN
ncbi:hypothetical protein TSOC_000798 [Tetrabaena socialis]|uniref:Uncharacterized protein n=1 Tax=Tetrabaena socialis TaxID=47790 RepID=A0A2J8AIG5_9CHLO|nr:hypothetical protein TSOC_000798 [Tetrabaena socialis]|eukprot:PNH12307.1 hypothetical protein TSOC_000798 [Tetrabaena socialis]